MPSITGKQFNLPWHQQPHYWIALYPSVSGFPETLTDIVKPFSPRKLPDGGILIETDSNWHDVWMNLFSELNQQRLLTQLELGLASGVHAPANKAEAGCRSVEAIQAIAESLWLGDALIEDRVVCYLQPICSDKDRVVGYESFARVIMPDGKVIAGDAIIAASKILGIEYMIDRHLHIQAIKTFASSAYNGFLFVNFFPGFIHRPAVYLEGLSDTAKANGIISKHVVLEFTNAETPRDLNHMRNVCDYARSRGYSVALDDIASLERAEKLVSEVRPDFLKIDMQIAQKVKEPHTEELIRNLVMLVHQAGGTVVAEGVETEEMFRLLKSLNVDLFQGYYFAAPAPVDEALRRNGTLQ